MTTYQGLLESVRTHGLEIFGAFHTEPSDGLPDDVATLVLLGPREPGFWEKVTAEPEFADGRPDPLDRWSRRVIGQLACKADAKAYFPFTGPPWHPFIRWAHRSGRAWPSQVKILVHDTAGLMVSYRGAIGLRTRPDLPATGARPCDSCADRPCLVACPAGALTSKGYDIQPCREYLSTDWGKRSCMARGCLVRRACPLSQTYGRLPEQSAYHMSHFQK